MSEIGLQPKGGLLDRLFWDFSYKNRRYLLPVLLVLVLILAFFLIQKFFFMEMKLKKLSQYEPIYVSALKRNLNIGDVINKIDLKPLIFYKDEFNKITYKDEKDHLEKPSLILFEESDEFIGRVVKQPIFANSFLRKEYLAVNGTLPGLINLIDENHALVDITVPQTGFNVYIKPNDFVDLYQQDKFAGSKLIATKVAVILVDSQALGKAPLQVVVNNKAQRHLTLSVAEKDFATVAKAIKNKNLYLTYQNSKNKTIVTNKKIYLPSKKKIVRKNIFQPLFMIYGDKKELAIQ